jgi:hypothetical protein
VKVIFSEKPIGILSGKRTSNLRKDKIKVINKLKKRERLTGEEFWRVYASSYQEGPAVKYSNPETWVSID